MSRPATRRVLLAIGLVGFMTLVSGSVMGEGVHETYRDPAAPIAERVRDLLSRMTVEETAAQLSSIWFEKARILDEDGSFSPEKARSAIPNGIGQVGRPGDNIGTKRMERELFRTVEDTIALVNAIQRFAVEQTRLGIPVLFHEETARLQGAGRHDLPGAPRARKHVLGPVLDLMRDPRYGPVPDLRHGDRGGAGTAGAEAAGAGQGIRRVEALRARRASRWAQPGPGRCVGANAPRELSVARLEGGVSRASVRLTRGHAVLEFLARLPSAPNMAYDTHHMDA